MGLQDMSSIAAPFCSVRQAVLPVVDVLADDPNFDRCSRLVVRHVQKYCGGETILKNLRVEQFFAIEQTCDVEERSFKVHVRVSNDCKRCGSQARMLASKRRKMD